GLSMSYLSVAPFGQSVPRLVGASGSPSTCTTVGLTFFALSPRVWMMTPHATAQYGQMLRVSVVRAILSCRISARACEMSNPIPAAARVEQETRYVMDACYRCQAAQRRVRASAVGDELRRFDAAVGGADAELRPLQNEVRERLGPSQADIFEAQTLALRERGVLER